MKTYEIEQYELHTMRYRVEANTEAEAIAKLFQGEGEAVDNSLEYIEVAEDFGMPANEHRNLAKSLRKKHIWVDAVIPSIRSIEEV
jgi:hypothetical protein